MSKRLGLAGLMLLGGLNTAEAQDPLTAENTIIKTEATAKDLPGTLAQEVVAELKACKGAVGAKVTRVYPDGMVFVAADVDKKAKPKAEMATTECLQDVLRTSGLPSKEAPWAYSSQYLTADGHDVVCSAHALTSSADHTVNGVINCLDQTEERRTYVREKARLETAGSILNEALARTCPTSPALSFSQTDDAHFDAVLADRVKTLIEHDVVLPRPGADSYVKALGTGVDACTRGFLSGISYDSPTGQILGEQGCGLKISGAVGPDSLFEGKLVCKETK